MLDLKMRHYQSGIRTQLLALCASLLPLLLAPTAHAADAVVTVTTAAGQPSFTGAVRWTLEEDVTYVQDPANPPANPLDSPTLQLHKSYMPVAQTGHSTGPSFTITGLDAAKRYYLSILPDRPAGSACTSVAAGGTAQVCYTMTGAPVVFAGNPSTNVRLVVNAQPLPPAQIRIFAFEDVAAINNLWDPGEVGLGGFPIFIYDMGGILVTDVYGNPLGTTYEPGTLDSDAAPTITRLGDGTIRTMTADEVADPARNPYQLKVGEALVRNIAPGKYGVQIVPPQAEGWQQTTTIEGTRGVDVWVRAGEPILTSNLVEFGPTFAHVFMGFVRPFNNLGPAPVGQSLGSISGTVSNLRMARAPDALFYDGQPMPNCHVALNGGALGAGVYAAPCDEGENNSAFTISGVPPGAYQLVVWDKYLDLIIGFFTVTVGNGQAVDVGRVSVPMWFHAQQHYVFNDLNENGQWEPTLGENGIPDQTINFRFRDGSIYQTSTTDTAGYLPFDEVFPFFSWLIAEVDFARFKATGVTIAIDEGREVFDAPIGAGTLINPQPQDPADGGTNCGGGTCQTRTETGPILLEGFNGFAGNTNIFEWGKKAYPAGQNGGITGVVWNQVTRAENDPRYATAETWETGVPRTQVNLYRANANGVIQDSNGIPGIQLADVDNQPLGWSDGTAPKGPEDQKRCLAAGCAGALVFDQGDAIDIAHTDSFDDGVPTGCRFDTLVTLAADPTGRCYDGLRNWAQVRPAVFDGGYAFGPAAFTGYTFPAGNYVVEANAPVGYLHQDEASKNVDFGDTFAPEALPPVCLGDPAHTGGQQAANFYPAGAELSLFPGVELAPALTNTPRPACNFKSVLVTDGKNAAADFFVYTEVPVSGHIQGLTTNDLGNEPNLNSPNFGEKAAPAHIPLSLRDFAGNEINRIYTDDWGHYNGLVPSSYRISVPMPSGVSPEMAQICLNPSTKPDPANFGSFIADPFFDPRYSQTCYVFNFTAGKTTYLDTPVLPVAAFVSAPDWQLDCAYPGGTPIIREASINAGAGLGTGNGPYIAAGGSRILTLRSVGTIQVPDPVNPRPALISRNFGFGTAPGTVLLNGTAIPGANVTWGDGSIVVNVPATAPFNTTGQIEVVTGAGVRTVHGITLIQGAVGTVVTPVAPGGSIQAAIDVTPAGGVVLVAPGLYYEGLFITKPIQLQGWGAAGTIINAARSGNFAEFNQWRVNAHQRANCLPAGDTRRIGLLPGQPNNVGPGTNKCLYQPGTGLFAGEEHAAVIVAPVASTFGTLPARIDGFTFTGAEFSGGLIVNGFATNLEISNNVISNNQGPAAGGIRVGHATLFDANNELVSAQNRNLNIHNNQVMENGSTVDHGGGIGLYNGSDNYRVSSNYVCGNFSQGDGGGIGHFGRSPGGVIEKNRILFNQSFDQTATGIGGSGGGILVAGHQQPVGAAIALSAGSGSVQILSNTIQGNQAGAGDGGGIALRFVNGQDVLASGNSATWNRVDILNNIIVNNVTGLAGGGISLQDALRVAIVNNTIANNDSAATAQAAFGTDPTFSIPQPAGVVSRAHSATLNGLALVGTFSDPTLQNNIILGNRQQHWEAPATPGASGLSVDGVQDLAVLGVGGSLNPQRNILTATADAPSNAGYDANNPRVALAGEDALLVAPYFNGPTGSLSGGAFGDALLSATANDEGGNFVTVIHGPLSPVGNYHLEAGSSAIDPNLAGGGTNPILSSYPALLADIDGNPRPVDGTTANAGSIFADLGADEAPIVVLAAAAPPQILSTPPGLLAYVGVPYSYQVLAVDPNGTPITYGATCLSLPGSVCGAGPSISSTGSLIWTPGNTGGAIITIRACSAVPPVACTQAVAGANRVNQSVVAVVVSPAAAPVATADSYGVNRNDAFSVPAPGVLGNDPAPSPLYGPRTAELVSNLATGGSVTLAQNGAFTYLPAAGYVGTTSFQYRVSATTLLTGITRTSGNTTVTLNRELAATSMEYFAASGGGGEWRLAGLGSVNGRLLTITLDRTSEIIGTATVSGGAWALSTTAVPGWINGDTVTITANAGGASLGFVPVAAGGIAGPLLSTDYVQCPGDLNNNALQDGTEVWPANQVCRHLAAGDGFIKMADGVTDIYTFGFNDVTGVDSGQAINVGILNAQFPAPTLDFDEGDQVYLTLSNVGTLLRPDLFDPHTVHFHGFPNAGAVFDGVPESSVAINGGFSFTYYYNIVEPGTFMYHCHVEAPEHMQMGMLGNLYVRPAQNNGPAIDGFTQFVYNDGDGSTGYDVEVPIQIGSMDSNFHSEHLSVQPLPFALMHDDFPMLNGRGYPDTVNPAALPAAADKVASGVESANESSQTVHTRIEATAGQRILLRISNLNVTRFYTLATTGLTMKVVGTGAHILRGPGGAELYYETGSVTLGGGESAEVLIDTTGVTPGTYLLYSTNLEALSNGAEDFGGMMTEIVIN